MTRPVDKYDRAILEATGRPGARLTQLSEAAPGLCASALNRRAMELVRQRLVTMTPGERGAVFEITASGREALRKEP